MAHLATITKKVVFYGVFAMAGLIAVLYLTFWGIMKSTEYSWVVKEPFHESIDATSTEPHQIILLDEGAASLAYRLDLIESAQTSIELEFFIYKLDASSRLVTQALARKAEQGVAVKLLVDFSFAVLELAPAYAKLLEDAGVEIKYYNTSSVVRFFTVQHRTHRKIMVVDDKTAVIGGRNIADDYFDLSPLYNFLDSDIAITGEIVAAMKKSFDLYWTSPMALDPEQLAQEQDDSQGVSDLLVESPLDRETQAVIAAVDLSTLPQSTCSNIQFITDYPGSSVNFRKVFRAIGAVLERATTRVLAESPYFIVRGEGADMIRQTTARGVKITVLTNSLASTDAYYTVAAAYPKLKPLALDNFRLLAYRGTPPTAYDSIPNRAPHWGVHSKRAVIDDQISLIGTYNLDPRSANLNAELMVACYDSKKLAADLEKSILARIADSDTVINQQQVDTSALVGNAEWDMVAKMFLIMPVSHVFDFLL